MTVREAALSDKVMTCLIAMSEDWEREDSTYGYRTNTPEDLKGNRVFLAMDGGLTVGYLFGHMETAERMSSVCAAGTAYFEVEELYVRPPFRSRGVGKLLFQHAERAVAGEAEMIMLSTATKNYRAILHFYVDELDMRFWSARLFKKIESGKR